MSQKMKYKHRSGAVLLVVLIIIMVITVLSLGFLSRSDVELACGRNMVLREQMDYLAESGFEHTKGLILNPQDVDGDYFTGATGLQLVSGSNDYYDIFVTPDLTDKCNYTIDCNAYEYRDGEKVGQSNLRALLRLDPCVALWTGNDFDLSGSMTINGDVYCNGDVSDLAAIDGDLFSLNGSKIGLNISGQLYDTSELSLEWPDITVDGYDDKSGVTYESTDYTLASDIEGMLLVKGDLTIQNGLELNITASKNLPALFVSGDLIIGESSTLNVYGLAAVDGKVLLRGNASINDQGALFAKNGIFQIASDTSGNDAYGILYNGPEWAAGHSNNGLRFDGTNDKIENYSLADSINGLSAITLSLWIKSDVTNADRDIMYTSDPTGSDIDFGIRYDQSGAYGGSSRNIKASITTSSGYTQIESSTGVQTTGWQHLALTWENDSNDSHLKLYINGIQDTLSYDRCPVYGTITGIEKIMLGCGSKNEYWDGLMDEVRIYGRALSSTEIQDIYNGNTVSSSNLIMYWNFDETDSDISITVAPEKSAIILYDSIGVATKWGQAAGAFYKSIERR